MKTYSQLLLVLLALSGIPTLAWADTCTCNCVPDPIGGGGGSSGGDRFYSAPGKLPTGAIADTCTCTCVPDPIGGGGGSSGGDRKYEKTIQSPLLQGVTPN